MSKPTAPELTLILPAPTEDAVPADVRAVVELFRRELAQVAFPDVDAAALAREAEAVRAATELVAQARAALDAAVAQAAARTVAARESCARALAYARIYSDAHPERQPLAAALSSIAGARLQPDAVAAPPKRRGRPPKRSAELFDGAPLLQPVP